MAAKIGNPRKSFQFSISLLGLNPFLAQEVTLPDVDLEQVEHGDTNFTVKTAGMKKVGNLTVNKISSALAIDRFVWDWIQRIQDTRRGGGDLPDSYKITCFIEQYSSDGLTVNQRWQLDGVWPTKINGIEFSRTASNNTIENIEFSVDDMTSL